MNNENKTSDNPKGHAPLAGVVARFFKKKLQAINGVVLQSL